MPTSSSKLQEIRALIREGKNKQAVTRIAALIEKDPRNPDLWWLLANATEDTDQARRALDELRALRPSDDRVTRMMERLETRQLLSQMGIQAEKRSTSRRRTNFFIGFSAILTVLVLLVIGASVLSNRDDSGEIAAVPTEYVFATLQPTAIPATETPAPAVTQPEEPAALLPSEPAGNPEAPAAVPADVTVPEATAEVESLAADATVQSALPLNPAVAQTTPEVLAPESTAEALPLPDPESTAEAEAAASAAASPSNLDVVTESRLGTDQATGNGLEGVNIRGQVVVGEARQEVMQPYEVRGWQFSVFRGENITLDLQNLTGSGSVALQIVNAQGVVITEGSANGTSNETSATFAAPADGVYTAVVRINAVDEQLYSLSLARG